MCIYIIVLKHSLVTLSRASFTRHFVMLSPSIPNNINKTPKPDGTAGNSSTADEKIWPSLCQSTHEDAICWHFIFAALLKGCPQEAMQLYFCVCNFPTTLSWHRALRNNNREDVNALTTPFHMTMSEDTCWLLDDKHCVSVITVVKPNLNKPCSNTVNVCSRCLLHNIFADVALVLHCGTHRDHFDVNPRDILI